MSHPERAKHLRSGLLICGVILYVANLVHRLNGGDIPLNTNFWSPRVV
jgi:hypothetical protein